VAQIAGIQIDENLVLIAAGVIDTGGRSIRWR
jgi:hypothetical protein